MIRKRIHGLIRSKESKRIDLNKNPAAGEARFDMV